MSKSQSIPVDPAQPQDLRGSLFALSVRLEDEIKQTAAALGSDNQFFPPPSQPDLHSAASGAIYHMLEARRIIAQLLR